MAEDEDRQVAGSPAGNEPPVGAERGGPARETVAEAAPPSPPPPPLPSGPRTEGVRGWARRRPVQLVAAGLVGAIIGGGFVGFLDVLDDGHDGPGYGRGHHQWMQYDPDGPRRWRYDRGEPPMMPGPPDGRGGPWQVPQQTPPAPAPSASPSAGT